MKWKDQWRYVRDNMKNNRLRVTMTVLATVIGTAFLILLASVGFGFEKIGKDSILSNGVITEVQVYSQEGKKIDASLRERPEVYALGETTHVTSPMQYKVGEQTLDTYLMLRHFGEEQKIGKTLSEGRYPQNDQEVVVGYHFKELLNETERDENDEVVVTKKYTKPIIGTKIETTLLDDDGDITGETETWTVVGVGEPPKREWNRDESIYAPTTARERILAQAEPFIQTQPKDERDDYRQHLFDTQYVAHAKTAEEVKALKEMLEKEGYMTYSVLDELDQFEVFFLIFKIGLIFVGTIAVFIASIGIFNTMTMAVTERTAEIGQMKALGAQPSLIRRLFLLESGLIGLIGTIIAVIISYILSIGINFILPYILQIALDEGDISELHYQFSYIPWQLVVIASLISLTVAIISGWRPAKKATKIDIIDALRMNG